MIIGEDGVAVDIHLSKHEMFDTRTWRKPIVLTDLKGNTVYLNLDEREREALREVLNRYPED